MEHLLADNKLFKRSPFGSRRERFDDPAQALLFDPASLAPSDEPPAADAPQPKKEWTSKGRRLRVFPPEFLPRDAEHILRRVSLIAIHCGIWPALSISSPFRPR